MISKRTAFIFGAGAHCSYGFPSGETLKKDVVQAANDSMERPYAYSLLQLPTTLGIDPTHVQDMRVREFATALQKSGQGSIDAFLHANRHQHGFQTIGKALIAQVLLKRELEAKEGGSDDWLGYVFRMMIDGITNIDEFVEKNNVSFITFNYDRYFERWMTERLQYSFGIDWGAANTAFKQFRLLHMYGSLGELQYKPPNPENDWMTGSTGIRTIFDAEHDQELITEACALITSSHSVCFLGYGFHRENNDLLSLETTLMGPGKAIAASSFGITIQEFNRHVELLGEASRRIGPTGEPYRCLQALRSMQIF